MNCTKILLVDDHAVVRNGYRMLLDAEPDLRVVAEAASADEAYQVLLEQEVDVAVMDISLRGSSGIEAMVRMHARCPKLRMMVFSMHDSSGYVTQAIRAGALGYVTKASQPGEMLAAVRKVAAGKRVLSPEIAFALATESLDGDVLLSRLSPREFEVLRMVVNGDAPEEVALRMHLSTKTILNHLTQIRQKLEVDTAFGLLKLALRHGLLHLDAPGPALHALHA